MAVKERFHFIDQYRGLIGIMMALGHSNEYFNYLWHHFKFWDPTPRALYDTIGWAVSTYYDRKHHLATLIRRAMSRRFSWDDSAREYVQAYARAIKIKGS